MAEVLARELAPERLEVYSAGTEPSQVRENTLTVLEELGYSTAGLTSKSAEQFLDDSFDYVVTVCDHAREVCPTFPGAKKLLHWSFPDPSRATGNVEEQLAVYRQTREMIQKTLERFLSELN